MIGFAVTDSFEIVFDSVDTTRKVKSLLLNPRVAFVIGGWIPNDERTVQYEGVVDRPEGTELERLKSIYYAKFPTGPETKLAGYHLSEGKTNMDSVSGLHKVPPTVLELDAEQIKNLQ